MGLFNVRLMPDTESEGMIRERLYRKEALMAMVLPADFSAQVAARTNLLAGKALKSFGLDDPAAGGATGGGAAGGRAAGGGAAGGKNERVKGSGIDAPLSTSTIIPSSRNRFGGSAEGSLYSAFNWLKAVSF